jgi:hypothetical protein
MKNTYSWSSLVDSNVESNIPAKREKIIKLLYCILQIIHFVEVDLSQNNFKGSVSYKCMYQIFN